MKLSKAVPIIGVGLALNVGLIYHVTHHRHTEIGEAALSIEADEPIGIDGMPVEPLVVQHWASPPDVPVATAAEPIAEDDDDDAGIELEFGVGVEPCDNWRQIDSNIAWSQMGEFAVQATQTPELELREQLSGVVIFYPWESNTAASVGSPIVTMTYCENPYAIFEVLVPTESGTRAWLVEGTLGETLLFQLTAIRYYGDY